MRTGNLAEGVGTMTGTGTIDQQVTGGSFMIKMAVPLGIKVIFTGNVYEAKTFSLPLTPGFVSWYT